MKKIKKLICEHWVLIAVSAVFLLITFAPYIYHLHSNPISKKAEDWAAFGNYVSGTLGSFSIFVLAYTLIQQFKSLDMQRESVKLQNDAIKQQQEDNLFGNLVTAIIESKTYLMQDVKLREYIDHYSLFCLGKAVFFKNKAIFEALNITEENHIILTIRRSIELTMSQNDPKKLRKRKKKKYKNDLPIDLIEFDSKLRSLSLVITRALLITKKDEEKYKIIRSLIDKDILNYLYALFNYARLDEGEDWSKLEHLYMESNFFKHVTKFYKNSMDTNMGLMIEDLKATYRVELGVNNIPNGFIEYPFICK